jgi:hypothetical protein
MKINYALHKNPLPGGAGKYRAMIISKSTLGLEAVIERMVAMAGVNPAQAQAMIELFFEAVEDLLLRGFKLRTAYLLAGLSLKGNFDSSTDLYNPKRHQLKVTLSPGPKLRRAIRSQARLHRQAPRLRCPRLLTYLDINSGRCDSLLTPGGVGQLDGKWLKYDPADPEQGLFFIAADRSASRAEVVAVNTSRQLIFQVPADLPPGLYHLEVRTILTQAGLRQGRLDAPLMVE